MIKTKLIFRSLIYTKNVDIKSKHTTCMKLMNLSLTMDPACLNPSGEELAMAISVHCTPLSEDIYDVAVK